MKMQLRLSNANAVRKNSLDARYEIGQVINCGRYGMVYAATHKPTGRAVAAKMLPAKRQDMSDQTNAQMIHKEIKHMRKVRGCKGVVNLEDIVYDAEGNYVLIEELCGGITLQEHVATCSVSHSSAGRITHDLLTTIKSCHAARILHMDIKPTNIVYSVQDKMFKLTDFGASQWIGHDGRAFSIGPVVMTPSFAAPELLVGSSEQVMTPSADVWAVGVLAYLMLFGKHPFVPFDASVNTNIIENIIRDPPRYDERIVSDSAIAFLKRALDKDPARRATVDELLASPFVQAYRLSDPL